MRHPTTAGPPGSEAADLTEKAGRRRRERSERYVTGPPEEAIETGRLAAQRVRRRDAPVRRLFIERENESQPDPPLALILRGGQSGARGGRGGAVRLKVYLSMLWLAAGYPYDVRFPARAWASLLGLPNAMDNGARRVSDAVDWLNEHEFVSVESRRGRPPVLTLRSDGGPAATDRTYRPPGEVYDELKGAVAGTEDLIPEESKRQHRYVQVPAGFWMNGWAAVLSGPAVAMLLVLLSQYDTRAPSRPMWFSPEMAVRKYALSEDTRTTGLLELQHYGVATMRRQSVNRDVFDFKRMRNTYHMHLDVLGGVYGGDHQATSPLPTTDIEENN